MANNHGGKRTGAGRPKGSIGTKRQAEIIKDMVARGETPLDYFNSIMKDPNESKTRRDWAAAQAAPYCHPRLASVDQTTTFKNNPLANVLDFIDGRTATLDATPDADGEPPLAPEQSLQRH